VQRHVQNFTSNDLWTWLTWLSSWQVEHVHCIQVMQNHEQSSLMCLAHLLLVVDNPLSNCNPKGTFYKQCIIKYVGSSLKSHFDQTMIFRLFYTPVRNATLGAQEIQATFALKNRHSVIFTTVAPRLKYMLSCNLFYYQFNSVCILRNRILLIQVLKQEVILDINGVTGISACLTSEFCFYKLNLITDI